MGRLVPARHQPSEATCAPSALLNCPPCIRTWVPLPWGFPDRSLTACVWIISHFPPLWTNRFSAPAGSFLRDSQKQERGSECMNSATAAAAPCHQLSRNTAPLLSDPKWHLFSVPRPHGGLYKCSLRRQQHRPAKHPSELL